VISPNDGDPRHGTANGYGNLGCRCPRCQEAHAAYHLVQQHERRGSLAPEDKRHGTYNGYRNYGCRCPECKDAHYEYARGYYLRTRKGQA
jgi:hypothetical protein